MTNPLRKYPTTLGRRRFLRAAVGSAAMAGGALAAPAIVLAEGARPAFTHGLQSGDVAPDGAVVWARTDRPARLLLEVATRESFEDAWRVVGPDALKASDFTAKQVLTGLSAGQQVFYRARWQDLAEPDKLSAPLTGRFRTAPAEARRDLNL